MTSQINLDATSIELTASSVAARIWIELDGVSFPEASWYDFPVPILTWWIDELSKLLRGENGQAVLQFMDGPYEVRLRSHEGAGRADLFVRGVVETSGLKVDLSGLLVSALAAARTLLSLLSITKSESSDLQDLARAVTRAQ